jgi:hypothetical protein
MIPSTVVGTVTGNGAAKNIIIGFKPDYVQIVNVTDGDAIDTWFRGMAAATSVLSGGASGGATRAAPNGITEYAGVEGEGFTIGAGISENAKVLRYVAIRSGPGST